MRRPPRRHARGPSVRPPACYAAADARLRRRQAARPDVARRRGARPAAARHPQGRARRHPRSARDRRLVVLADEATKLSPFLTGSDKAYLAWIVFGVGTPTLDAEGPVVERGDAGARRRGGRRGGAAAVPVADDAASAGLRRDQAGRGQGVRGGPARRGARPAAAPGGLPRAWSCSRSVACGRAAPGLAARRGRLAARSRRPPRPCRRRSTRTRRRPSSRCDVRGRHLRARLRARPRGRAGRARAPRRRCAVPEPAPSASRRRCRSRPWRTPRRSIPWACSGSRPSRSTPRRRAAPRRPARRGGLRGPGRHRRSRRAAGGGGRGGRGPRAAAAGLAPGRLRRCAGRAGAARGAHASPDDVHTPRPGRDRRRLTVGWGRAVDSSHGTIRFDRRSRIGAASP